MSTSLRTLVGAAIVVVAVSLTSSRIAAAECVQWTEVTVIADVGEATHRVCVRYAASPGGSSQGVQAPPSGQQEADGGGSGGSTNCVWEVSVEGVSGEVVPGLNTREESDGTLSVQIYTNCGTGGPRWIWVPTAPNGDPAAPPVPVITPADLIPDAFAEMRRQLPTPVPRIAPADDDPDGFAFVQNPVFFWIDQAAGQWENVSVTASAGTLSLTMTAAPEELIVDPGDGATVTCVGAPPPFPTGADPTAFDGCAHTYTDSSAMAPNGQTFPVTTTIVWHVSWTASNGESGDSGTLTTTSPVRELPVAEIQAIITG